ncbi:MAG: dTDP-glucose 4,6-dehydratase [Rectinemataceae bacterium]|nr:dTDP-glucose 4,6-dehydratase [Rectinemataceae bacterium]
MRKLASVLVTGGSGFIGTNFIRHLFSDKGFSGRIVNLDALTYAGNPENLADIDIEHGESGDGRYRFVHADICDRAAVEKAFADNEIDTVVHFAAESHVDRSILGPETFIRTNVMGTYTLLDVARNVWSGRNDVLFHHISTDEVFGSLGDSGYFTETTPYDPRSPYSASKASSDHLALAYFHTYGLPVTLSNCSNNYGPWQFPEKLVPLMILNMLEGKPLPVYGDGKNIRDWLYVEDHNEAVWTIMKSGAAGRTYNVGGENEWENIGLLNCLIELVAEETGKPASGFKSLISYVKDRPGHDRRYAIDCGRLKSELGWKRSMSFEEGLRATVRWYISHRDWCARVRSGEYKTWMDKNYQGR